MVLSLGHSGLSGGRKKSINQKSVGSDAFEPEVMTSSTIYCHSELKVEQVNTETEDKKTTDLESRSRYQPNGFVTSSNINLGFELKFETAPNVNIVVKQED